MLLTHLGYEVVTALTGEQALEQASREFPDLIILDVMMPGMDGFEVSRALRQNAESAHTPILMFTAKALVDDKRSGYDAGVNLYLTKPVHPIDLQASIKTLLSQRQTNPSGSGKQGYVVGVLAAKGGMGTSTLALNLAISYHQKHDEKVIAAELRPGQGTWAQELNLNPASGLAALLQKSTNKLSKHAVNAVLVPTAHGVQLLLASNDTKDIPLVESTGQLEAILQQLAQLAGLVVLDIGTPFHPAYTAVADFCDELIVVTEPHPTAARRTQALLQGLRTSSLGRTKDISIVTLNRNNTTLALSAAQIAALLGEPVALEIPPANEAAFKAAEAYTPLISIEPDGVISQRFAALADLVRLHAKAI